MPSTTENVVVDAPMPSPSANTAMTVNAGVFTNIRAPKRMSFHMTAPPLCRDTIIFYDAAVEQMHGPICILRKPRVMGHHANGGTRSVQFLQQIHHRFAITRIEVSSRL